MKRLHIADAAQHQRHRVHLHAAEGVSDCQIEQAHDGKTVQVFAHCADCLLGPT